MEIKKLKVALVHDYIKEYGGAERVLEVLHEIFPEAPVFTSVYLPKFLGPHRERFKDWDIRTSWLQYVPFKQKLIGYFVLISPWVFRSFDLSDYDLVIVSATGGYMPNMVRTKKRIRNQESGIKENSGPAFAIGSGEARGAVQICYCHTPPRYLYGYATAREWRKDRLFGTIYTIANHFLRMADFEAAKNVDYYIANSEEVKARIQKFYRRDAVVIYPPVGIGIRNQESGIRNKKGDYYLSGGRLARAKRIDLVIRACSELGVSLKVFGKSFAGYEPELRELAGPTIEFLGEVSDEEKLRLMQDARAFIFAAKEEDFGIIPVEAMSMGTPVIVYKSGGVKETVVEGKTGIFFEELSVGSLKAAIKKFEGMKMGRDDCVKQASKFSKETFIKNINLFIQTNIPH